MRPRQTALFGLLDFPAPLSCAEDALGQSIDVSVGASSGTLTLPSLPVWEGDPLHKPLLAPLPARAWKTGKSLIDWGRPFSFPSGKGGTVRRALMEFQAQPGDFEAVAQQIYSRMGRWSYLFAQYVTLFTAPHSSRVLSASDSADRIELYSDDGQDLRYIASDKPKVIEFYMSQTDESLHLDKLKEACRLSSLGLSPRLEYQLILEAYTARRNADYRKAVIEATTALEVSLTNRALEEFRTRKISFGEGLLKKFRALHGRFELVRLLSIPFPEKNYQSLIVDPRNDVVHKAEFPDETIANQVIVEVEQLLRLFSPQLQDENRDSSTQRQRAASLNLKRK